MGDAEIDHNERARRGDDLALRGILKAGRVNMNLALELYCQLVKQTHRCRVPADEVRPWPYVPGDYDYPRGSVDAPGSGTASYSLYAE